MAETTASKGKGSIAFVLYLNTFTRLGVKFIKGWDAEVKNLNTGTLDFISHLKNRKQYKIYWILDDNICFWSRDLDYNGKIVLGYSWIFLAGTGLGRIYSIEQPFNASDPLNAALTFNSLNIWPVPAVIPGDVHFSADITVNKAIHKLYIDEDVDELISKFFFKLPCVGEGFGSFSDVDICHYRDQNLPEVWERFMFYMLGNDSDCPVPSKAVAIQDEVISINDIPMEIANFANRMFRIRLNFKNDKDSQDHIGCLEFEFEFDLSLLSLHGIGKRLSERVSENYVATARDNS